MTRDQIRTDLVNRICSLDAKILVRDLRDDASLVDDLGLDSLDLAELSAAIRDRYDDIDLTDWYIASSKSGHDTLASLVDYIASRWPRAVAQAGAE
jgi:acyl carrier protein